MNRMIPTLSLPLKYKMGKHPLKPSGMSKYNKPGKRHLNFTATVIFPKVKLRQYYWHRFVALCFRIMAMLNLWLYPPRILATTSSKTMKWLSAQQEKFFLFTLWSVHWVSSERNAQKLNNHVALAYATHLHNVQVVNKR